MSDAIPVLFTLSLHDALPICSFPKPTTLSILPKHSKLLSPSAPRPHPSHRSLHFRLAKRMAGRSGYADPVVQGNGWRRHQIAGRHVSVAPVQQRLPGVIGRDELLKNLLVGRRSRIDEVGPGAAARFRPDRHRPALACFIRAQTHHALNPALYLLQLLITVIRRAHFSTRFHGHPRIG